jgi:hypothetical protein
MTQPPTPISSLFVMCVCVCGMHLLTGFFYDDAPRQGVRSGIFIDGETRGGCYNLKTCDDDTCCSLCLFLGRYHVLESQHFLLFFIRGQGMSNSYTSGSDYRHHFLTKKICMCVCVRACVRARACVCVDWDSIVGIAAVCGLEGLGTESRWKRDFLHQCRPALGSTHPPIKWVPGHSPRLKRPGRDINYPSPCSAEVKERVYLYICSLLGYSWFVLGRTLPFTFT